MSKLTPCVLVAALLPVVLLSIQTSALAGKPAHFDRDPLAPPFQAYSIVTDDLDGDAPSDVAGCWFDVVRSYLGRGDATLMSPVETDIAADCHYVEIVDLDEDAHPDLVAAVADEPLSPNSSLVALLGAPDGTFVESARYDLGGVLSAVATGDFDGDEHADVVAVTTDPDRALVLLGGGDGTLQAPVAIPVGERPSDVAVADFDRDGIEDFVTANVGSSDVTVAIGRPGLTPEARPSQAVQGPPLVLAAGDLGYGAADDVALATDQGEQVLILRGDGAGNLELAQRRRGEDSVEVNDIAVAHLNRDRRLDVVAAYEFGIWSYLGHDRGGVGKPTLQVTAVVEPGGRYWAAESFGVADLDLDGRTDILAGTKNLEIFRQRRRPFTCRSRVANVVGSRLDDSVLPALRLPLVFHAGAGEDRNAPSRRRDLLCGGKGVDGLRGGRGPDRLYGGPGPDQGIRRGLTGESGDDVLVGGRGPDRLGQTRNVSETGNDVLRGGPGNDVLKADAGDDILWGGRGRDVCDGGPGRDRVLGCEG